MAVGSCAQMRQYVRHEEKALYLCTYVAMGFPECAHNPARLCKHLSVQMCGMFFSYASLPDAIGPLHACRLLRHELCWRLAVRGITLRSAFVALSLLRRMGLVIGVGNFSAVGPHGTQKARASDQSRHTPIRLYNLNLTLKPPLQNEAGFVRLRRRCENSLPT